MTRKPVTASEKREGLLFLLVGPSAVGKNTLMTTVLARSVGRLRQLPTATTRPMRPGEQQGREHLFVTHEAFEQMIANNALIEYQKVYGNDLYGIPRATVEAAIAANDDLIADIEVLGATYMRSLYPDNVILIFIAPESVDDLADRIQKRGFETEAEILSRMERVPMEMSFAPLCDYLIVNDNADSAAETLRGIILAENSRRDLLNLRADSALPRHRFAYAASVVPYFDHEVLFNSSEPHFPTVLLAPGELPHEAALRALSQSLNIVGSEQGLCDDSSIQAESAFIPPLTISSQACEHYRRITFVYQHTMPQRITPPDGWKWASDQPDPAIS
jgi:guanylate kinase